MQNKKTKNKILALMLSFLIILSNITNIFAYERDLVVPTINSDNVIINGNNSAITNNNLLENSTVIINADNSITPAENNLIISNTEINEETTETVIETFNEETGLTVKARITRTVELQTAKGISSTITLVGGDKGADPSVSFKGDESGATPHALIDYITRENNDPNAVSYCISPFYAGAKENGTTTVTIDNNLTATDKQLLGIAVAWYPYNKYNITGFSELSEQDQYYATLIAMEHLIFQKTGEYKNKKGVVFNDASWSNTRWYPTRSGDTNAQKIINVAQQIYLKGVANPYDETKGIATVNFTDNNKNDGTMKPYSDKDKLTVTINSDIPYSHALIQFDDPKIKEWATGDTKIQFYDGTDENGTRLDWGTHQIDGQQYDGILVQKTTRNIDIITIVIDKATADSVITGDKYTLDYTTKFFGGSMQVAYKTKNTNADLQDYATITSGNATARSSINWMPSFQPSEPPTETTTATTTTMAIQEKGGFKILKYNAKTNQLVAGAIFRIRGISQGVYDFNVQIQASNGAEIPLPNGGIATCKDGVIELENINVGTYEITQITPPPNFDLALGQNSQTVQVENQDNATLYPQLRFMNNPYGSLKNKKVDAVTGEALAGATLKISNLLFNYEQEFTTGADGTITINDLKQGSYEITEVQPPNGYILSNETKVAVIKWGEETTITYENEPKTSLQITKIDSETGQMLNGARFKLKHTTSGAKYFTDATVGGITTIEDLISGTYILTEIQAPNGYIFDETERNIVIENDKVNEITIINSKKPSITVNKVDSQTKEPLIGAKFELWRAENNTTQGLIEKVGEYYTNERGQVTLNNLDYGWYAVKEVIAPQGYLLAQNNTQFVYLEPNQTDGNQVSITFENDRKPSLKVVKLDKITKEPLQDAKFELWKAENNTTQGLIEKVGEYFTNQQGEINLDGLDYGWYAVKEVQAPNGYLLFEDDTKFVFLEPNQTGENQVVVTFENDKKPSLKVIKRDIDTKEVLSGAKFEIYRAENATTQGLTEKVGEYFTNEQG